MYRSFTFKKKELKKKKLECKKMNPSVDHLQFHHRM